MQKILDISHWKKRKHDPCLRIPVGKWRILKKFIIDSNPGIKSKIDGLEEQEKNGQEYIDILNQRSYDLYMKQDYSNALYCCRVVLSLNSNDITALDNMGKIYGAMNDFDKALQCYNEILKTNDRNIEALIGKGRVFGSIARYDNALKIFDDVLDIDPKNKEGLKNKGIALYKLCRYKESTECFEKALKQDPRDMEIQKCREIVFGLL